MTRSLNLSVAKRRVECEEDVDVEVQREQGDNDLKEDDVAVDVVGKQHLYTSPQVGLARADL